MLETLWCRMDKTDKDNPSLRRHGLGVLLCLDGIQLIESVKVSRGRRLSLPSMRQSSLGRMLQVR